MPPQNGGVKFDSEGDEFSRPVEHSSSGFADRLVSWGIVSSREQAQYVLIGVIILALLVTAYALKQALS